MAIILNESSNGYLKNTVQPWLLFVYICPLYNTMTNIVLNLTLVPLIKKSKKLCSGFEPGATQYGEDESKELWQPSHQAIFITGIGQRTLI